jgi:hypothetical protein
MAFLALVYTVRFLVRTKKCLTRVETGEAFNQTTRLEDKVDENQPT